MKSKIQDVRVSLGSGNVFADVAAARPDEAMAKAKLARQIGLIIARDGLTQAQVAERLGIDQPKVSALTRGRLRDFSIERLMRFAVGLGHSVQITIGVQRVDSARLQVAAA